MIDPGRLLPETGRFRAYAREINILKRAIIALRPMDGNGTKVRSTAIGTAIDAAPRQPSAPPGEETSNVPRWG